MAKVLQTRFVGYTQDASRHVMAPQEIVYVCEEPARRRPTLTQKALVLGSLAVLAYFAAAAVAALFFGIDIT